MESARTSSVEVCAPDVDGVGNGGEEEEEDDDGGVDEDIGADNGEDVVIVAATGDVDVDGTHSSATTVNTPSRDDLRPCVRVSGTVPTPVDVAAVTSGDGAPSASVVPGLRGLGVLLPTPSPSTTATLPLSPPPSSVDAR